MKKYYPIIFRSVKNKNVFFYDVANARRCNIPNGYDGVSIRFPQEAGPEDFEAMQITLLCCLIGEFDKKGYAILFAQNTYPLRKFLAEEIYIHQYWEENKSDHVEIPDENGLTLWRVVEKRIVPYSRAVHEFLKRKYFADLDLSALEMALMEMYYNVCDHAQAEGIAFSYIKYQEETGKIYVAVCDFGQGIAQSLRTKYPSFSDDKEAVKQSLKKGISAQTKENNKGMGLNDIVSFLGQDDALRIVSNRAFLICIANKIKKTYDLNFDFCGTLLYFDILVKNFEKEDLVESFTLKEEQ